MKRILLIFTGYFILSLIQLSAQEYTAASYWNMEHDPLYTNLLERQTKGDTLSAEEQKILGDYKVKLSDYFNKLSDTEKSVYYRNRAQWTENPNEIYKVKPPQQTDIYSGERSKYTQYLVTNGFFGAFYGAAACAILGVEDEGVITGVTLLSAGASILVPVLSIKDRYVSYNSLALSTHGKLAGALQGAALGVLLVGDNIEEEGGAKLTGGLAVLSSIALGRVGYSLGKNKPWSEGRAALYSYYGLLMPFEGFALDAAFQVEDPRIIGLTSLAFGAGGYLMANSIANRYDYTRGDITAIGTLATLNGLLGLSIFSDIEANSDDFSTGLILIPAAGALGASLVGHLWLKDAKLSAQQGRNVALGTAGGSIIGLGLIALIGSDAAAPYYVTGYVTGMTTYAIMVSMYKKNNRSAFIGKDMKTGWNFNVMPQNLFLNKRIASYALANPTRKIDFLPAFSATLKF
jgi:hypothetical protein